MKYIRKSITFATTGIFVLLAIACVAQSAGHALASDAGKSPDVMVISGLPDFQALAYGKNTLSIAAVPVSQQDGKMTFGVTGLAASYPGNAPAVVYRLSEPMPGTLDLAQKTLQIDLGNFNTAASAPEKIDKSRVGSVLRADANTSIIDVTMDYKSLQGSEAIFRVSSIGLVKPDGQALAYTLGLPGQLVIDGDSKRLSMA